MDRSRKRKKANIKSAYRGKILHLLSSINETMLETVSELFVSDTDPFFPQIDLYKTDGYLVLLAEVPGAKLEDLYVWVDPEYVILRGEIPIPPDYEEDELFIGERSYGPFQRKVKLPYRVEPAECEGYFGDGILRLDMIISEDSESPGVEIPINPVI